VRLVGVGGATRRSPPRLLGTVRGRPELRDLVLYLEAREAAHAGDDAVAIARVATLGDAFRTRSG
jgi:hypothetical protein